MEDQPPITPPDDEGSRPDAEARRAARLLAEGLSPAGSGPATVTAPSVDEIAVLFPKLEILEVLGQGGMGVVYKARQARLDRAVALKVLYRELAEDPAFPERFEREAKALARLDHPHIVRVHDFGETDGLFWLLLEYVDGASLRALMSTGQMSSSEALGIVPQICDALQYAHDEGVVHRDIKPENVLIDAQGRVKIADFGLAKLVGSDAPAATLTGTHQVMGTWQYMAPEQYRAPQDVDHRADIFSLGVIFYEMLTGDLPVGRYQQPSETQELDHRIDGIVMRTLEREREARYQHASDVRRDVQAVEDAPMAAPRAQPAAAAASTSAASAPPPSLRERVRNPARILHPGLVALVLGFIAVSLCLDAASDGTYDMVGTWWTRARVYGSLLWGAGVILGIVTLARSKRPGVKTAAVLALVLNLVPLVGIWAFDRGQVWGAFFISRWIDYETRDETWVRDLKSRYASGARLPTVEVRGGRALQEDEMRAAVTGVLKSWQSFANRAGPNAFSALSSRGVYTDETAEAIYAMAPRQFERERETLDLGFPFVTEAQLGRAPRELYVNRIVLEPDFQQAMVEAQPRDDRVALAVRFPMVRGAAPSDWRFARGRVTILNRAVRTDDEDALKSLLLEGGTLPTVEGGQLASSRRDVLRGVLTLWRQWMGVARDRDLTYRDLRKSDRVEEVYGKADSEALFEWLENDFEAARERLELGMGFVTLEQMGIPPHRCQVVHIELDDAERTAFVEARPVSRIGTTKPGFYFHVRRDEGRWWFAVMPVEIDR